MTHDAPKTVELRIRVTLGQTKSNVNFEQDDDEFDPFALALAARMLLDELAEHVCPVQCARCGAINRMATAAAAVLANAMAAGPLVQ